MPTATITGPVYGVSQTFDFISMSIVFELSHWDSIDDVGLIASGPIIVPVDENGQFSVDLVLNSAGSQVTNYQCFLQYRRTDGTEWIREPIGVFSLSAEGTYQLSDLTIISVEGVSSSLDVYTQILSVLDSVNSGISTTNANVTSSNAILSDANQVLTDTNTVYQNLQSYGSTFLKFKNDWVTSTAYIVNDVIIYEDFLYICLVDHTSDVFSTDLTASNWELFSSVSGLTKGTEPSLTYASMLWYDTANNILKMRSEANDAWADIGTFDQVNNTFTAALVEVLNENDFATDSETQPPSQQSVTAYGDARWLANESAVTSLIGSESVTFTGIPSWARQVELVIKRASATTGIDFLVQVQVGGSDVTTGYYSQSASNSASNGLTTGMVIEASSTASLDTSGVMTFFKEPGTNTWVSCHAIGFAAGGGDVDAGGVVDGLTLIASGTTFDNGSAFIRWRR